MPHVAFVPFTGFRVREEEMRALGMSLPSLRQRADAIGQLPALGLLTLAGLTPPHWHCTYHETGDRAAEVAARLIDSQPDLVAISALTASIEEAYRFSGTLRRAGLRVVLGGLHATALPDEALLHADAVVCGEGEPVWPQVLAEVESRSLKRRYGPGAAFDLGQSPVPCYDLLGSVPRPRFTLQTQRGCPFACEFCAASRLLGTFREKPLANIERELAAIATLDDNPLLELADDNTFAGERDPGPLFDAFARAGARYFTEVDWRIGERPEVLAGLAASGCVQVLIGLESLVFRHPGMGAKQAELRRMLDAIQAIQEAGVAVIACFIVGCDGETRASLDRLARFILDQPFADVQLTLQTPFPGTALHRRLARAGRLLPERGWSHYTLFDVTYQPDLLSVAELETGFRHLVQSVFSKEASAARSAVRRGVWANHPRLGPCPSAPGSAT
jgi:radical SAM superfamily enzyme YgiQ (UPF0313 family)